ncbi:hypothetical protein BU15DRAFT_48124 [Melanogaster broomeanus]|nr:hypothetical protein BU15DRAFT_48124 [Melanogaster broomeanus]
MPAPGNKSKGKGKGKSKGGTDNDAPTVTQSKPRAIPPIQCLTLEKDELTPCGQPLAAVEGHPKPERCKVHHGQYHILYKKYKDASKLVDEIRQAAALPKKEEISRYTDWHAALEKARWVRQYLEAIRVEMIGRDIHQRRFFLQGELDDVHKRRLMLLQAEWVKAVDVIDELQARAFKLCLPKRPLHDIQPTCVPHQLERPMRSTEGVVETVHVPIRLSDFSSTAGEKLPYPPRTSHTGNEDLIDISMRAWKEGMLAALKPFTNFESFTSLHHLKAGDESTRAMLEKKFFIYQQYARRIIFNQPTLFMNSLERVSFKDLILSDSFSTEDLFKFFKLFMMPRLEWFKDAVLDALAMSPHDAAANVRSIGNRLPLLGGWVFDRAHAVTMSNEAWWPPANVERYFVRLCNSFDDLIGFLSFGALGLVPPPRFCQSTNSLVSRNHLSLSGVVIADMMPLTRPSQLCGPIPTIHKAKTRGCVVWAEIETRAYMFGAVRNEPDVFVDAFLRELRARPDLFQVVTRSETDPGRQVEIFGDGPSKALPAIRSRAFEAPPSYFPPSGFGKWTVIRSAVDILYGNQKEIQGYLTALSQHQQGWFFSSKKFPVKYFVILDTVPNRDHSILARNVAWAALCAGGYGKGKYGTLKYAIASNKLVQKCTNERLGWLPKGYKWKAPKMQGRAFSTYLSGCTSVCLWALGALILAFWLSSHRK